jgi:hypothetical protein
MAVSSLRNRVALVFAQVIGTPAAGFNDYSGSDS